MKYYFHAALAVLCLATIMGSSPAKAEPTPIAGSEKDQIFPTYHINSDVEGGFQVTYGYCPCLRWTIKVDLGGGDFETRDFLFSTDALFRYAQTETPRMYNSASHSFRIGAIEALIKGAHVGLAFDGVTVGEDLDRSYSDIMATGFEFLVSIFRTNSLSLTARSGYEYEQLRVNAGPENKRNILSETIAFKWKSKTNRFNGAINATIFADPFAGPLGTDELGYKGSANVHANIVNLKNFTLGAAFQTSYEHDPFRGAFGLNPNIAVAGIYFDVGLQK